MLMFVLGKLPELWQLSHRRQPGTGIEAEFDQRIHTGKVFLADTLPLAGGSSHSEWRVFETVSGPERPTRPSESTCFQRFWR